MDKAPRKFAVNKINGTNLSKIPGGEKRSRGIQGGRALNEMPLNGQVAK
jgi:hypothetical protein